MKNKLPDAPPQNHQRNDHHGDTHPPRIDSKCSPTAISADIFGELSPVFAVGFVRAAFPQACLKSFNPRYFVQLQYLEIASKDSFAEYSTRQIAVLTRLQCT